MSDEWAGGHARALVYGDVEGGLVFVGEQKAREQVVIYEALGTASTWGELREILPADARMQLAGFFDEGEEPRDADAFDAGEWEPYVEGDWPPWLAQRMLDWVPERVRSLGSSERSAISGDSLALDPGREREVVGAFQGEGFTCRRDDELVRRASYGQ
jgi:hypothetical protein